VKALFVTTHFPPDIRQGTSGTFKRMRTIIDALREKASVRLLFYYIRELDFDAEAADRAREALKSAWQFDDVDIRLCRQDPDPSHRGLLWGGHLSRTLSIHHQRGYVRTSGNAQLRAFEECLEDQPDFVFAHRLYAMCPILLTRRELPPVFMDLDDVEHRLFLRDILQPPIWLTKRLRYLQWPALLLGERRAIQLSRKTFVCSDLDAQYLEHKWGLLNVRVIPNSIRIPEVQPLSGRPVLLFLGLYAYNPNAVAAEHLITRIWPFIRAACPEATLLIAGAGPECIPPFTQRHPGVEYTGFVDDLDGLYRRSRVVCCPIQSGGGTRIKIIEAAAYGKPVVSTQAGAEGLDFVDGREILLRDNPRAFAETCIELLRDDAFCTSIGQAARTKAVARYDRESMIRLIQAEIFGSLQKGA
jgi:glycosyltransferase involved in cell wall biosynthesis